MKKFLIISGCVIVVFAILFLIYDIYFAPIEVSVQHISVGEYVRSIKYDYSTNKDFTADMEKKVCITVEVKNTSLFFERNNIDFGLVGDDLYPFIEREFGISGYSSINLLPGKKKVCSILGEIEDDVATDEEILAAISEKEAVLYGMAGWRFFPVEKILSAPFKLITD